MILKVIEGAGADLAPDGQWVFSRLIHFRRSLRKSEIRSQYPESPYIRIHQNTSIQDKKVYPLNALVCG